MIGFHMQNSPPNWLDAVAKLPPGTPIKLVEGVQSAREVKATNPALKVWFRHVADNQNVGGDLKQYARTFFNTFIDTSFLQEAKYVDWIQELNEYTGHGQTPAERAFWEDWAAAAAHVWWNEYRTRSPLSHIRLIIGEPGIGNDLGVAFAQIADTYDCLIGYHSYIPVHNGQIMPLNAKHPDGSEINEWKYYSGRWATMDNTYRQHGYYVDWVAGEGGPIRDASPWYGALDPMGGWKHPECCSGHIDCYITALHHFLDLATTWNAQHNGRFKGMTLFTSGAPGSGPSWEHFDLRQPHMDTIAAFVADYMANIPDPPDPPPPPTNPGDPRVQYNRTVLVTPAQTPLETWLAICEEAYADRRTVSFSYDDAGLGNLKNKTAVLYDLDDSQHDQFTNWYKTHYPGTAVTYRSSPTTTGPQPSFTYTHWPTEDKTITQGWAENPVYYLKFGWTGGHEGIDIRAPLNSPIYAPAAGTITSIENLTASGTPSAYGWHIHLDHGNGYTTILAHLAAILPAPGDHITAGQLIAHSGNTGNTTGPHLHLSLKHTTTQTPGFPPGYIDPTPFIQHLTVGRVANPPNEHL